MERTIHVGRCADGRLGIVMERPELGKVVSWPVQRQAAMRAFIAWILLAAVIIVAAVTAWNLAVNRWPGLMNPEGWAVFGPGVALVGLSLLAVGERAVKALSTYCTTPNVGLRPRRKEARKRT